jgi:beta-lactamase regulating signal transducer with metallopeptidase domain
MILTPSISFSSNLLANLADPAARALVLAAAAALALAAFRVKATSARLFTWTAVLYAALAMPLLGWLLPPIPIPTPEFGWRIQKATLTLTDFGRSSAAIKPLFSARASAPAPAEPSSSASSPTAHRPQRRERLAPSETLFVPPLPSAFPWATIAASIYLLVTSILLARFFVGLAFTRRLLHASHPITDLRVTQTLASRARAFGMARIPRAAESEFISVPVTLGALRPTILLPSNWTDWDDAKLSAVLAHELSHVARRDALTQCLSLLHRAVFWFSPLAWWLDRYLALLAEQASDEAALSCGTDRNQYARILLEFFEALHAAPGRVWWQGVAMAKPGHAEHIAEERVERILSWKGSIAMQLKKSIAVAVVALAIPVVYLAAAARPTQHAVPPTAPLAQDQTPPPAQPAPKAEPIAAPEPAPAPASEVMPPSEPMPTSEPAPPPIAAGVSGGIPGGVVAGVVPIAPVAPLMPPPAWRAQTSHSTSYARGYSYSYGYDDNQRFVIVTGKSDSLTMSGSTEDAHHVEKLRKSIPGDFIWFQRDEKSYIIRDQATIDRAKQLWAPQDELGRQQDELGKQQDALGKQQDELGAKMEQIKVNVPDMTAELDKLKAELKALGPNATLSQMGDIQSEMGELQNKMGELQTQAGEQQGKLGEEMGALGEKQGKLGEQQGELGRRQAELAQKASREMKQLLDEAIKKGLAQPEL